MTLRARHQLAAVSAVALTLLAVLVMDESIAARELVLPGAAAGAIAFLLATFISSRPRASIRELTAAARALAGGDVTVRAPLSAPGELGELGVALGRLSDHLSSRIGALKHEQALLSSLVEALDEGVVTLDARREVTRINSAARTILAIREGTPFSADLLPRSPELKLALEAAARGQPVDPVEATIGMRHVSLVARPLPLGNGIVLAMFDLTRTKQLETVRRDFVANVSHELRTPLTVISGFAETLSEDEVPAEMQKQFVGTIRMHAQRMQQMVEDLLDLSRLESGGWAPQQTTFDLHEVAADIIASHGASASARNLDLVADIPKGLRVSADRTAIRQIFSNLVDNAIRHTESGSVTMFGQNVPGQIVFGVRDTGTGIPLAHLSRIFERFYRVDSGRARDKGGTGLGLAIVKHLAEAHGGTVAAESEVGSGTTITISLPAWPEDEAKKPLES
jgi:two-component system phosphate regulon sensor histidine kinase PhoR